MVASNASNVLVSALYTMPSRTEKVWKDNDGKEYKDHTLQKTAVFITLNGIKYRIKSPTLAVRERSGTRDAVKDLSDQSILAHPKWKTDVLRATNNVLPEYVVRKVEYIKTLWRPASLVYYGIVFETQHIPRISRFSSGIGVFAQSKIILSLTQTDQCPHPLPIITDKITLHSINTSGRHTLTPEFKKIVDTESELQKTDDPDITKYLVKKTILFSKKETATYRPRQGDNPQITHTSSMKKYCVIPVIYLTDLSTKKSSPSLDKPADMYGMVGDTDREYPDIIRKLEEMKTLRGTLKQQLAEYVYEPARISRLAETYNTDFDRYITLLSGEAS